MGYKKDLPCNNGGTCPYEQYAGGADCDRYCGDEISKLFYSALSEITNIEHVKYDSKGEEMTVNKVLNRCKCGALEGYKLTYQNVYGNRIPFPTLDRLGDMPVKAIHINFPTKETTITLRTFSTDI